MQRLLATKMSVTRWIFALSAVLTLIQRQSISVHGEIGTAGNSNSGKQGKFGKDYNQLFTIAEGLPKLILLTCVIIVYMRKRRRVASKAKRQYYTTKAALEQTSLKYRETANIQDNEPAVNEADQDLPNSRDKTLQSQPSRSFPKYITRIEDTFSSSGGKLSAPWNSDVSIIIRSGTIPGGIEQRFFFGVIYNGISLVQNVPDTSNKTLISPVIECGPHNIEFLKPVKIIVPHCLVLREAKKEWVTVYRCGELPDKENDLLSWEKVPNESEKNSQSKAWYKVKEDSVHIKTNIFSLWSIFGCGGLRRKRATVFCNKPDPKSDLIYIRFYVYSDSEDSKRGVELKEREQFPDSRQARELPFEMYKDNQVITVKLTNLEEGWVLYKSYDTQVYNYKKVNRKGFRSKEACEFAVKPKDGRVEDGFSCVITFQQEDHPQEYQIYLNPGYTPVKFQRGIGQSLQGEIRSDESRGICSSLTASEVDDEEYDGRRQKTHKLKSMKPQRGVSRGFQGETRSDESSGIGSSLPSSEVDDEDYDGRRQKTYKLMTLKGGSGRSLQGEIRSDASGGNGSSLVSSEVEDKNCYSHRQEGRDDEPLTEKNYFRISAQVGDSFKNVPRELSMDETIIRNLKEDYNDCEVAEKCYQEVLARNDSVSTQRATTEKLYTCDALLPVGCSEALKTSLKENMIGNETDHDLPNARDEMLHSKLTKAFPKYITRVEGKFSSAGGKLSAPLNSDVSIIVDSGTIPDGIEQSIFFGVIYNEIAMAQNILDTSTKTLISPVIECGPHDIEFSKPVKIIVPHCLDLGEAKKEWVAVYRCGQCPDQENGLLSWEKVPNKSEKNSSDKAWYTAEKNSIHIRTKTFSIWSIFACGGRRRKRATVFHNKPDPRSDLIYLRFYVYSDNEDSKRRVEIQDREAFPNSSRWRETPFKMSSDKQIITVRLANLEEGWRSDKTNDTQIYVYDNGFRSRLACDFAVKPEQTRDVNGFSCVIKFQQEDHPREYSFYFNPGYTPLKRQSIHQSLPERRRSDNSVSSGIGAEGGSSYSASEVEDEDHNGRNQNGQLCPDSPSGRIVDFSSLGRDGEPATERHFLRISHKVGASWRKVLRELTVDEPTIENLKEDYITAEERFYQGLLKWKRKVGEQNATTEKLCDALRLVGCSEALKALNTL